MNIEIDCRSSCWYRGTGIGTYTFQLVQNLLMLNTEDSFQLHTSPHSNFIYNTSADIQINICDEPSENNFWKKISHEPKNLSEHSEIYHVPHNGIGLPHNLPGKSVITLHDVIPLKMPETVSDEFLDIFKKNMDDILTRCDGIITVSEYSKKDILESFDFPEDKIYVTPLASEPLYKPINKELSRAIIKNYYGLEGDLILYIGGFSPRKNILGLIEAFSKLNSKCPNKYKLIIAGFKGRSYPRYQKRVDELGLTGQVLFPGFIELDHLPYLYNASKLFIYPSFYEGFGLPPLEAMSCGIPVVSSSETSIPEVLDDAALFINPQDVDSIFNGMWTVLDNPELYNELVDKGLHHSYKFSWKETAKKTLAAYEDILKK